MAISQWIARISAIIGLAFGGLPREPAVARAPEARSAADTPVFAPILMYHHVGAARVGRFNVTTAQFADQLRWLRDQGYRSVTIAEIAAALDGGNLLPPKPIAITFDDGWRDQHVNALPLLNEFGFKATFFVVSGWVGRGATLMSWDDVRQLTARGHAIGSHSVNHRPMAGMGDGSLAIETIESRNAISRELGGAPLVFAYPLGSLDARAEAFARAAGYVAAVGVPANPLQRAAQRYRLNRIEVRGTYTVGNLASWLLEGKEGPIAIPRSSWWTMPAPLISRGAPPAWSAWRPAWLLPR